MKKRKKNLTPTLFTEGRFPPYAPKWVGSSTWATNHIKWESSLCKMYEHLMRLFIILSALSDLSFKFTNPFAALRSVGLDRIVGS